MKIRLEIEEQYNRPPWYRIMMDDDFIEGFWGFDEAEKAFNELKENPNRLKKTIKVLESHEFVVPLQEENNNN